MHTVLLVGDGRLARHLIFWNSLQAKPLNLILWNRKKNSFVELNSALKKADLIWLAISDSSLSSFYAEYLADSNIQVVHFSGALQHDRMICAHPLMSFPTQLMEKSLYSNIHIVLTGAQTLNEVLPGFQNSFSKLEPQHKALYHSLCVVAGNFPQLLWLESLIEFKKLKIPEAAIETYIQQITSNFLFFKDESLTGPLMRKDYLTLEKNIFALQKSKLKKIYESFVGAFVK